MSETPALRQHRFLTTLFAHDWPSERHVRACYGYAMREHAETDHPGEVTRVELLGALPLQPEDRDAWLFGYRFRDTHPEPPADPEAQP